MRARNPPIVWCARQLANLLAYSTGGFLRYVRKSPQLLKPDSLGRTINGRLA